MTIKAADHMATLVHIVEETSERWIANNPVSKLKGDITRLLTENKKKIIYLLLGFNDTWGTWQLDTSRDKNNSALKYLRETSQKAITEWFDTIELPEITEEIHLAFIEQYKEEYKREFQSQMYSKMKVRVHQDVNTYFKSISTDIDDLINKNITLKQLLEGEQENEH